MQMSYTKRQSACNLPLPPTFSEENYPHLNKETKKKEIIFKRFLTIKHADQRTNMTDLNPFMIEKNLKILLGKKTFYKVTKTRAGHLLIEVDRKEIVRKLLQTKHIGDIPVNITEHDNLNTCKGVIFCNNKEVQKMDDDEILNEMIDQDVKTVYRIEKRKEGTTDEYEKTDTFIITFNTRILPHNIKIGYEIIEVNPYYPNPRRCFNCQMYGHGKNQCTHDTRCATCGQEGHEYGDDECDREKHCFHCEQEHATTSKECPMFKLEKVILQDKIRYNLTFRQARERVYQANPHLTSQIPKLNNRTVKTTYSTILNKQQSIPDSVQQQLLKQEEEIKSLTEKITELVKIISLSHSSTMPLAISNVEDTEAELPDINIKRRYVRKARNKRQFLDISLSHTESSEDLESSPTRKPLKQGATANRQAVSNASVQNHQAPPEKRAPSSRQEAKKQPASTNPQDMETSPSGGAAGGVLDLTVHTPSHTPPAPLDQKAKKGVKGSSSGPPKDQKSDVSKKNPSNKPPYQSAKSKVDSHRK